MAEPKTKRTTESVTAFLERATEGERRKDCMALVKIMKQAAGAPAKMWGPSIVGFGSSTITYADGHSAEWPIVAFSPRKSDLTLYIGRGAAGFDSVLGKLGKHKMSGSCLHIKRLSDVDGVVLAKLLSATVKAKKKRP